MGESRLGGESAGAEFFGAEGCSDLGFGAELRACFAASELTCGVELCDEFFGAEGAVDEAWLFVGGILGANGRAKLFFVVAVFLLCDDTLL